MHSKRMERHGSADAVYPNKMTTAERRQNLKERQRVYDRSPKGKAASILKRHRRRHKEGGEVLLTVKDVLAIKAKFNFRCFKCTTMKDLTLDHHIPLAKGGKLEATNIVVLCRKCNGIKADQDPGEFYSREELASLDRSLKNKSFTDILK